MADGTPPPGPAASPPPGSPPSGTPEASTGTGSSPATQPVANRGLQAAGLPKLAIVVQLAEVARMQFPPGSDQWRDIGKAMEMMAKHVPPGAVSQGVMSTELQRLQQSQRQNSANTALMRGMQGPPGGNAAPPQPPSGMPAA